MYEKELGYLNEHIKGTLRKIELLKSIRSHINQISFFLEEVETYSTELNVYGHGANVDINLDGWTETDVLDKILHPISELLGPVTKRPSNISRSDGSFSATIEYNKDFWVSDSYRISIICRVANSPDCEVIEYKQEVTRYKLSCKE